MTGSYMFLLLVILSRETMTYFIDP
jgi:hypothetical protein